MTMQPGLAEGIAVAVGRNSPRVDQLSHRSCPELTGGRIRGLLESSQYSPGRETWRGALPFGASMSAEGAYSLLPVIDRDDLSEWNATRSRSDSKAAAADGPPTDRAATDKGEKKTWRQVGAEILVGPYYQAIIAVMILANAVIIGLETDIQSFKHWDVLELMFLIVFTAELSVKLAVYGIVEYFNRQSVDFVWNSFDFMIVSVGIIDVLVSASVGKSAGGMATLFRIIRLLRILRIIRIVKFLKQLYLLAFGLAEAAQAVFWVTILMTFVLYTCSIIMVKTVGRPHPDDPHRHFLEEHFGTVLSSMLTLFVLMSSPNMPVYQDEEGLLASRPFLTIFLICFIIFGSFGMIALLTGVISESMFEKNDLRKEEARLELESMRHTMEERCEHIFAQVSNGDDEASQEDVLTLLPDMVRMFEAAGSDFTKEDLKALVNYMDVDSSGTISKQEFVRGMLQLAEGLRPITFQQIHYDVGACHVKLEALEEAFSKMISQTGEVKELVRHLIDKGYERGVTSISFAELPRTRSRPDGVSSRGSNESSPRSRGASRQRSPFPPSTPIGGGHGPYESPFLAPPPPSPPSPVGGAQALAQTQQMQQLQRHMYRLHEELDATKVAILQRIAELQEEPVRSRPTAHFGRVSSSDWRVRSGSNSPYRSRRDTPDWLPSHPRRSERVASASGKVTPTSPALGSPLAREAGQGAASGTVDVERARTGPEVAGREGAAPHVAAAGDDEVAQLMLTFDYAGFVDKEPGRCRATSAFSLADESTHSSLHGTHGQQRRELAEVDVAGDASRPADAATSMEEISAALASLMSQVRDLAFKHSTICESLADGRKMKSREIWSSRAEEPFSDRDAPHVLSVPHVLVVPPEPEASVPKEAAAERAQGEEALSLATKEGEVVPTPDAWLGAAVSERPSDSI